MEENVVRANEIEEIENVNEVEETCDSSDAGALIAGIVGGFLAYAMIGGAKKLWAFGKAKWDERKQAKVTKPEMDEIAEPEPEQTDSDEETDQ